MPESITRGIYVLALDGKLKVGYSTNLGKRLATHRSSLRNFELLGFIPGNPEMDAITRHCLDGRFKAFDWFPDTPKNRALLVALGMKQYEPVRIRKVVCLAIRSDLYRMVADRAVSESRRIRVVAERFLNEGLQREAVHA